MSEEQKYEGLRLEKQLCFPLYACSKEIIKKYKPFLDELDLTYTQYIAMLVLWDKKECNVKELGKYLYLDSGTLTPLLKKLEEKKYIKRERSKEDERNLVVSLTETGRQLQDKAAYIPQTVAGCFQMEREEALTLYRLLNKLLAQV